MPGYASNQFWNFGKTYEAGKTLSRKKDDNPNFIFPRPQQPDVYNRVTGKQYVDTRMQRGFIRGIYQTVGAQNDPSLAKIKQRRLFFQFNPATIDRTVEMNAMVANPLLQDPSQIFQPVAGTAAFSFDLTFNREAEVVAAQNASTQMTSTGRWATDTANPLTTSLDEYGKDTSHSDVASLGVLADLYVLDSIIGQSITPDTADFIKAYFTTANAAQQANAATQGTTTVTNPDGSTTVTETKTDGTTVTTVTDTKGKKTITTGTSGDSTSNFDATGFETNITKNYGNGAFLSPMPIRIVFSSLFMVEGYVESSSVRFAKFTKNYVPTVCAVTLTVRALYIGFAKEEAYLTTALKTAVKSVVAEKNADNALIELAKKYSRYGIAFYYTTPDFTKTYVLDNGTVQYGQNSAQFNTVQGFWNAGIWPPGDANPSGGSSLSFGYDENMGAGVVTSWISPQLAKQIKNGIMSWTFSSSIKFEEINATSKQVVKSLFEGPFTYLEHGAPKIVEISKIAENANKGIKASPRKNRYGGLIEQDGLPTMNSATSLLRMTITHIINMTVQTSAGPVEIATPVSDYIDIAATVGELGNQPSNGLITVSNGGFVLQVGSSSPPPTGRRSTPN